MKVLLLDPRDPLRGSYLAHRWDLIVDFGRSPLSTYEHWCRQAHCRVMSFFDLAEEIEDLYRIRELLRLGQGILVDEWGIDWWDLLSVEVQSSLHELILVNRLSGELSSNCQLYASRSAPLASGLAARIGTTLLVLNPELEAFHRVQHYYEAFSRLDFSKIAQVAEDKLDGRYRVRRRFSRRHRRSGPVVLLPSAYINVSRTALDYAASLPDRNFLMVFSRRNARPSSLPKHVELAPLAAYSGPADLLEIASLTEGWRALQRQLVASSEEFRIASKIAILNRIPELISWGLVMRDAWLRVFDSTQIVGCLSADDSNPATNLPLLLAKHRGIPALACHHGALNYQVALKSNHADCYLVKSEMEEEYVRRVGGVQPETIVSARPVRPTSAAADFSRRDARWLVFFTEPYQNLSWRVDEIYAELLPRLYSLAQQCNLNLALKLHPFESARERKRTVPRHLGSRARDVRIISGPLTPEFWCNTRFAVTAQSSVALECSALGIPVFLLAWLRDHYSGYVAQYARFGVGHVLHSPERLSEIPAMLKAYRPSPSTSASWEEHAPGKFDRLLFGGRASAMAGHDRQPAELLTS